MFKSALSVEEDLKENAIATRIVCSTIEKEKISPWD